MTMTIGIAGLGLIGGSMAKSIRAHSGHTVLGMDINPAVQAQALDSDVWQCVSYLFMFICFLLFIIRGTVLP